MACYCIIDRRHVLSPLLSFDARSFKTQKRKPKKNSFNGISRDGIQREEENIQDLPELGAFFENVPLSHQGRPHLRR